MGANPGGLTPTPCQPWQASPEVHSAHPIDGPPGIRAHSTSAWCKLMLYAQMSHPCSLKQGQTPSPGRAWRPCCPLTSARSSGASRHSLCSPAWPPPSPAAFPTPEPQTASCVWGQAPSCPSLSPKRDGPAPGAPSTLPSRRACRARARRQLWRAHGTSLAQPPPICSVPKGPI